jgi:hypothetical protein
VPDELLRNDVLDSIVRLRLRSLQRQIHELRFLLQDAQGSGDREALRDYGQLSIRATARIRQLEQALNRRSVAGRRQKEDITVRIPLAEE